jgi:VWFA-related protein
MRIRLIVSLVAAIFALPGLAQQPASSQPLTTLKVQAREVLLPVTVRDKHGNLVTNLTASDFTLTEDGHPQTIKSFTRESNLPFRLGLLVDTSRSVSSALDSERKAAEKFVDLMLPADPQSARHGDQVFLIHFDREVELLEDFTNSRDKLDRQLEQMGPTPAERNNSQGQETGDDNGNGGYRNDRSGQRNGFGQYGGYGQNGGYGQSGGSGGYGQDRQGRQSHRGARGGGTTLYDAIYLASDELMKPKDGRKALIVFSDGVDRGSKETLNEAIDAAERANVSVYTIYFKGEEEHDRSGLPGMGRHGGMGGGGMGYPGGGGGWPGGGGYPGGQRGGESQPHVDGKKIMEQIATRTGARSFEAKKKDDLADIYNQIAEELRGQYLLTYTPNPVDNDGAYHKIALTAKKGDLTVVTREGYYAPGGDTK